MRVDGCCTLYYCFGDTLTSHDILYGITSGFILATDKSSMNLLNIKISIPSKQQELFSDWHRCPGGSMSLVVGSNSSYKPITNMALVRAQLCKLQKGCTRFAAASDKVYQLLSQGRWFSPTSSTTNTGRHDIAEILLKVALKHKKMN